MTYSIKLSLMSTYRIRKILFVNQSKLRIDEEFTSESQIDLERILLRLYCEKSKISHCINQLENLARMHQVLVEQRTTYGISEVENQILSMFRLNT